MKTRKFIDSMVILAAAGSGGNGCLAFRREKYIAKGGPDGGDGGRGGHVILRVDPNTDSLISLFFNPEQRAEKGQHGMGKRMHGRNGEDLVVLVPCGTEVRDASNGQLLCDLVEPGAEMIIAKGGRGGLGNPHWQTSTHQTPYEHTDGEPGEEKKIQLDVKLLADVGLVGFPNAGKSSILSQISHAHPKIGAYAFTTINPIIGTVMVGEDFETTSYRVADIPGIIKNAHQGVGLGLDFLRHIERATCLAIVVDMSGSEGRDPVEDYRTVRHEMKMYNPDLLERSMLVIANKMDLPESAENLKVFRRKTKTKPLPVSTETGEGLELLKTRLHQMIHHLA
jgi:GTP-binding protein